MIEINPGILAAQVVTFLIGMILLWKISWGPLTALLRERSSLIQKDMETAEQKRLSAEKLETEYRQQLSAISAKAQEVMNRSLQETQIIKDQILKSAQEESRRLMEKTKESMEMERARLVTELRQELSHLVVLGTEKLLRQTIDSQKQEQWSQEFLAELAHHAKNK